MGIVDSIYDPGPESNHRVAERRNFVASSEDDTTGHGRTVFDLLQQYCKESDFHFYRTIAGDETFTPQNLLKALEAARKSGVHLLNISAGKHRPDCNQNYRLCVAARKVSSEGVCVVAGAGNRKEDAPLSLFCPALQDDVISVGAYEAVCTTVLRSEKPLYRQGPSIFPNGSYWVEPPSEIETNFGYPDEHYCGYLGCTSDIACENNRVEKPWEGNIGHKRGSPDVLAPCHRPQRSHHDEPFLASGTSYAAPIVTGTLAMVLGKLFDEGKTYTPAEIKRAVTSETTPINEGSVGKLNVDKVLNELR